jgi:hypothetical protein
MPRPKRIHLHTRAPAHTAAAIEEWKTGIDAFLEWASKARTGETSPGALAADGALTSFSEGRFNGALIGVAEWAVLACGHIRNLVRDSHWHLRRCPWCDRWLLVKAENRVYCRRTECVRRKWAAHKAASDAARRELGGLRPRRSRRRTK